MFTEPPSTLLSLKHKREHDCRQLYDYFYKSFDCSFIECTVEKIMRKDGYSKGLQLLGEGRHFAAWKVPSTLTQEQLVIRIPHDFHSRSIQFRMWQNAIQNIIKLRVPLLPPIEIIRVKNQTAMLSPFGNLNTLNLASHWNPLETHLSELKNYLQCLGLKIDDIIQIAYWRNIPFLYDLSDLQFA